MNDANDEESASSAPDNERAARLKRLRAARDLTQKELAEELGVTPETVSNWERGRKISAPSLEALASALNSTPLYVREGKLPQEQRLAELIDRLDRILGESGDRRKAGGMRADFQDVARLIAELRGGDESDTDRATISSLREDVRSLTELVAELMVQLQEQGVVGEGAEPSSRTGTSEAAGPSTGSG